MNIDYILLICEINTIFTQFNLGIFREKQFDALKFFLNTTFRLGLF